MKRHSTFRPGWVKYALLLVLVACGGASGLYLAGAWPEICLGEKTGHKDDREPATDFLCRTHRFPLTPRDAKDSIEAPELATDAVGRVFLTWASKTGPNERTVFFTRTDDASLTFDAPRMLGKGGVFQSRSKGKKEGYERRATPHVAVAGNQTHLTWSAADADGGVMRLLLASSTDAGATFGPFRAVHRSTQANPTFTALCVGPRAEVACAWLGGPAGQQPFAAIRRGGAGEFKEERLVYAGQGGQGVCPCCPMAACFAPNGTLYVAFRNINEGYRDIALARLRPGQSAFEGPFPVVANTWKFQGCPHDGPSLAVIGDALHVVWMDARTGSPRCYHGRADVVDMKFTSQELHPIPVGVQGNAKLHVDAAGWLHAVWEESATAPPAENTGKHQHAPSAPKLGDAGRLIQYAPLGADGRFSSPQAVAPRTGAFQTRPTIAVTTSGRIFVAWNELDETGKAIVVTSVVSEDRVAREGRP